MSVQIGSKNFGTRHISGAKFICEALHPYTCILDIYVVSCKMIKIIKIDKWGISFSFSMALYFFTRKNSLKEAIKLISFSVSPNGVVFEPRVCCSVGWSRIVTWIWFWAGPNEDWVYDEVKIRHSLGWANFIILEESRLRAWRDRYHEEAWNASPWKQPSEAGRPTSRRSRVAKKNL